MLVSSLKEHLFIYVMHFHFPHALFQFQLLDIMLKLKLLIFYFQILIFFYYILLCFVKYIILLNSVHGIKYRKSVFLSFRFGWFILIWVYSIIFDIFVFLLLFLRLFEIILFFSILLLWFILGIFNLYID